MEWWLAGLTLHVGLRDAVVVAVVVGAFLCGVRVGRWLNEGEDER